MARDFSGTSEVIDVGGSINPDSTAASYFGWGLIDAFVQTFHIMWQQAGTGGRSLLFTQDTGGSTDVITTYIGGAFTNGSTSLTSRTGEWISFCTTSSSGGASSTITLYVDGSSDGSSTKNPESATGDYIIGAEKPKTTSEWDGKMFYLAIWSTELSSTELQAMHNGVCPFVIDHDNLVHFIPLFGNHSPEENWGSPTNTGTLTGTTRGVPNPPVELLENYL